MKIAILVLAAATVVVAQSEETSRTAVERAISDVETRFQSALAKRDRAELEKLLTNGFTWVHASGLVEPRSVFIAQAVRGMALTSQQAELARFEKTLAIYGDTVVATGTARNRFPDGLRETWFRQVRVYVKEDDGWKFAYGQGTPLYSGPFTDPNLYRRYAGTYVLRDGRVFKMDRRRCR